MSDLKTWVAVENNQVIHGLFQAPQEYVDSYTDVVVDREDRTTPPWYNENVTFLDVTALDPKPTTGWFKVGNGPWTDGNPTLTRSRESIPADGNTTSTVTFSQKGPKAPASVKFNVNGQEVDTPVVNGVATVDVTSSNAGDLITVSIGNALVTTITVEG